MLRYGSAWHDVISQMKAVTVNGLDSRHFMLCTDDSHAGTLIEEGHMDRVLRHAIRHGLDPMTAIQMATLNTAEHFRLGRDLGQIAPGRYADILLVRDLEDFHSELVIAKGKIIAKEGEFLLDLPTYEYPDWVIQSIHLGRKLDAKDFSLRVRNNQTVVANVIGIIENQAPTKHIKIEISPVDGEIQVDLNRDILKVALVERHKGTGGIIVGLVHGFGFTERCAVASTVAHDSHHMIVVGSDESMMALAVEVLEKSGGGQVVIKDGKVIGQVELPIAGLMSNQRAEIVAQKARSVLDGFKHCGCRLNNPNMQLSLLALVVIPELRISDVGLIDVSNFKIIPVVQNNG
jgi:adenine deaminase